MKIAFPIELYIRQAMRRIFFRFLERAMKSDDGRRIVRDIRPATVDSIMGKVPWLDTPYEPVETHHTEQNLGTASSSIFVTGRFRSGTTLLWNLFRHTDGCTAYYEPFNERRWFDPAFRGRNLDTTHVGVKDYWAEYEGLGHLAAYYDEDWTRHELLLGPTSWMPEMRCYIDALVERSSGRPVLQFNRIDFRLPWIRHNYPSAKIVHICRHPREQWLSTIARTGLSRDDPLESFMQQDGFYLYAWARDLSEQFPFLEDFEHLHPYKISYFLWRLSHMFAVAYGDISIQMETLMDEPEATLVNLFSTLEMGHPNLAKLQPLILRSREQKWPRFADDAWFRNHDEECEAVLVSFWSAFDSGQVERYIRS